MPQSATTYRNALWLGGLALAAAALLLVAPAAIGHLPGCNSNRCDVRAKRACWDSTPCRSRVVRKALAREMRGYRAAPMPTCTWLTESGATTTPPFALSRYRAYNASSGASGKFQFLRSTWLNIGGGRYAPEARFALPVYQERMARVLARQGIGVHWVNC